MCKGVFTLGKRVIPRKLQHTSISHTQSAIPIANYERNPEIYRCWQRWDMGCVCQLGVLSFLQAVAVTRQSLFSWCNSYQRYHLIPAATADQFVDAAAF